MPLLLLIDYENIPTFDLKALPDDAHVLIVLGKKHTALPIALVRDTQKLGDRLEWCPVETAGDNAADFVLAYELGKRLAAKPISQIAILSHDKGFDALARHISVGKRVCRRIDTLSELAPKPAPDPLAPFLAVLEKSPKSRPSTRAALEKHVANHYKSHAESERAMLTRALFSQGYVVEADGTLCYPKWPAPPPT